VCLNIRSGGGKRASSICNFLESLNPEIVVLTEWRQGDRGQHFVDWATRRQINYQSRNDGATLNGVFIAARTPFQAASKTPQSVFAGVLLAARFSEWNLLGVYFPQLKEKKPFFDACSQITQENQEKPFLLIGDLNTGNQRSDRDLKATPFTCANEFDALSRNAKLVDLWRRTNGSDAREWTWLSHRNNGFRVDHALANEPFVEWMQPSCHYDTTPRTEKLSDHSAVVITAGYSQSIGMFPAGMRPAERLTWQPSSISHERSAALRRLGRAQRPFTAHRQ
jgi:exodeoxyribonuclease III